MDAILVVNAGSSSVKFQIFEIDDRRQLNRLLKGQIDGIGSRPRLTAKSSNGSSLVDRTFDKADIADGAAAIGVAADWLRQSQKATLVAVGHRVVHGGPEYDRPIIVDREVVDRLQKYVPLAPLHQPNNLAPIRALLQGRPDLPQVACFDTAFHRGHSPVVDHFAIPEQFYAEGVRRYGFHGLSYEYISHRLKQAAPEQASGRVIVAHLGSGASMCALLKGHSIESTMGFTALDGLPMGTRPGQIDAGVLLYWIMEKGMEPAAVQTLLYHDSGLKGISGISNDMRELQDSDDPRAQLAVDYFVYRVQLSAGMLAAALGGLDAFVFTAGIGENSPAIRQRIVSKLAWLGAELDAEANAANAVSIASRNSRLALYVVPTDEELMIARHTWALLSARNAQKPAA